MTAPPPPRSPAPAEAEPSTGRSAGRSAGRREWTGLAVLVLPCLLISMDLSVLMFGLPSISADLAPSATQQLWIMDAYGFALAGLLITMGAVGDRIGRRRLLLLGAGAFGAASVCAAYAHSTNVLIGMRALLGMAAATLMPSTLALIRTMFHDVHQRRTAIAVWTGGMMGGVTIGPIVGGILLNHFWWGSVFLINLPAMALLLVLGPLLLPESKAPGSGRFDFLGSALSLAAILPAVYGVKQLAVDGYRPAALGSLLLGLALGALFVMRLRRAENPLVDLHLFGNPNYRIPLLLGVAGNFVLLGFGFYNTQYMQSVLGMSPLKAALWSLAAIPMVGLGLAVSGMLSSRVRPALLLGCSYLAAAVGALALHLVKVDSPVLLLLASAGIASAGIITAQAIVGEMVLTAAPADRVGAASALNETAGEFGSALGLGLLAGVGAAVYHRHMAGATAGGLPDGALHTARETVGGAEAVAKSVQGPAGEEILDSARVAYTTGLHYVASAGAIVLVLTAVLALRGLRNLPPLPPAPKKSGEKEREAVVPDGTEAVSPSSAPA